MRNLWLLILCYFLYLSIPVCLFAHSSNQLTSSWKLVLFIFLWRKEIWKYITNWFYNFFIFFLFLVWFVVFFFGLCVEMELIFLKNWEEESLGIEYSRLPLLWCDWPQESHISGTESASTPLCCLWSSPFGVEKLPSTVWGWAKKTGDEPLSSTSGKRLCFIIVEGYWEESKKGMRWGKSKRRHFVCVTCTVKLLIFFSSCCLLKTLNSP